MGEIEQKNGGMIREPVAIVGIGCRFSGVSGPVDFWSMLRAGEDRLREMPASRFDATPFSGGRHGAPGKIPTLKGGFVEDIDKFDTEFFGISPREAVRLDPQQRLILEVGTEALEDAGQDVDALAGSQTGVFIGVSSAEHEALHLYRLKPALIDSYCLVGDARNVIPGRLSFSFGLQGPSIAVDSACSSSLVAVHLACQSLQAGDSSMAVAGGVNVILAPNQTIGFSRGNMLSADGRCKAFDARADGFVRSEGAAVVILKRLSDALRDDDRIYAVILGGTANNGGNSGGTLMAPSVIAQTSLLQQAYEKADVDPASIDYVETHGAGTPKGDPIEANALASVVGKGRLQDEPLRIGSVKTNIGHTEAVAGVAGLIKVALSLTHRELPATLNFEIPNPEIPFSDLRLAVQTSHEPWPARGKRARAGVSAFGISGTNAHVVLEEAPAAATRSRDPEPKNPAAMVLPLSADTRTSLLGTLERYRSFFAAPDCPSFADVCYTAAARRAHRKHRFAVVATNREDALKQIESALAASDRPMTQREAGEKPRIVFVFPGQGSQWFGMATQLLREEPVFRNALEECDTAIRNLVGWSVLEHLKDTTDESWQTRIDRIQPAIFSVQVALGRLWQSWDVQPCAVVGQSMGEVAAAHIAGALSLEDAVRVICRRSRLLLRKAGCGAMAVVGLSLEETGAAISSYNGSISIAVSSSPSSTVVAGDIAMVERLLGELERRDVFCRRINVTVASHSAQMDDLRADLLTELRDIHPLQAGVPLYSTVRAQRVDGTALNAEYWVDNLREPVLFSPVVLKLLEDGCNIFLEISSHPVTLQSIEHCCTAAKRDALTFFSLQRDTDEGLSMRTTLGQLYTQGAKVEWKALFPNGGRCVSLPLYSWDRQRYWTGDEEFGSGQMERSGGLHPFLGRRIDSAIHPGTFQWQMDLSTERHAFLDHHRVQGATVLPAAVYCEMAFHAAREIFGSNECEICDVTFETGLYLDGTSAKVVQLSVTLDRSDSALFKFHTCTAPASKADDWVLLCSGTMRQSPEPENKSSSGDLAYLREHCQTMMSGSEHYQHLANWGLQYGPAFQGVRQLWTRGNEMVARLELPPEADSATGYRIHPVLLDSGFQPLVHAYGGPCMPQRIASMRLFSQRADAPLWAHIVVDEAESMSQHRSGCVTFIDDAGQQIANLRLQLSGIDQELHQSDSDFNGSFLSVRWDEMPARPAEESDPGTWIILADKSKRGSLVASALEEKGDACVLVFAGSDFETESVRSFRLEPSRQGWSRLFQDSIWGGLPALKGVIHLWSLDNHAVSPDGDLIETSIELGCSSTHMLLQELMESRFRNIRLWLITNGVQRVVAEDRVAVQQAPLWGLGVSLRYEHPELHCTIADLSENAPSSEIELLAQDVRSKQTDEERIAYRGAKRFAARLVKSADGNEFPIVDKKQGCYYLDIPFGVLDNFKLRSVERAKPAWGEVEIEVSAAGVIFYDLMRSLNIYPGPREKYAVLGAECAGTITAVGEGVSEFQMGDEVVAISAAPRGCFRSHVIIPAILVQKKPTALSFEQAAALPVSYMTSIYSLVEIGRICAGERVLIHSATGGTGLAAIEVARRNGAEVFATAGTPEKRDFLRSMGIVHAMDSRSLSFADEIMDLTQGEGVDLILNSLTGEAIAKNLSILRPYGRYLEIGKKDVYADSRIGLRNLRNNVSFSVIDLDGLVRERHEHAGRLLAASMPYMNHALPIDAYPIERAHEALQTMARAKHIGKIVISMREPVKTLFPKPGRAQVSSDATYLITGGLGALGLEVAAELADKGGRSLVLMGRREPSPEASKKIEALRQAGLKVEVQQGDVGNFTDVERIVNSIMANMPPLRGIVHAAGSLSDELLLNMTRERFCEPLGPKIWGAWNLHQATLEIPLDFFVLFSSAVAMIGSPGQANYAAGNAFMDALAHYRRSLGMSAQSINWGPWSEIGLAARPDRGKRLETRGFESVSPERGRRLFSRLLETGVTQAGALRFDVQAWCHYYPAAAQSAFFSELLTETSERGIEAEASESPQDAILKLDAESRIPFLIGYLQSQIAKVLRLPSTQECDIDAQKSLNRLGIDSLMTVELRNRIEFDLRISMPVIKLLQRPTITQLANQIVSMLPTQTAAAPGKETARESGPEHTTKVLAQLDTLSETSLDQLIGSLLAE
jgi:acyl transferase domain-containing protein/NADPH:quinone reductase-like Zn-dependent oxidoreductase/NAD(P)-dependent dehydrogenase (short-subunit alcohol dehydrogenase family)/acyl carrier protein